MRIKISFKVDKLPILYRHRIMALIKESLNLSSPEYKRYLYPEKNSRFSKRIKPFTFSVTLPDGCEIKKEKFLIDENTEIEDIIFYLPLNTSLFLYISSCNYEFIVNLYNGFLRIKQFDLDPFNHINIILEKVFLIPEKKINTDEIVFKTNSPILIEDKTGRPLLPIDTDLSFFNEQFNIIHEKILQDLRADSGKKGKGLYQNLEIVPINIKKQIVKHTLKEFREKTGKPYMILTTFNGYFKIKGDPRDLLLLYQSGVGLRTGQGFGMVEVV